MKNYTLVLLSLLATYCSAQSDNVAKVHIESKTKRGDIFLLFSTMHDENETKTLTKINEEVFETEIKVSTPDIYMFRNGKKGGGVTEYDNTIYLEPGYDLKVFIDENNSKTPYIITGKGEVENQMLIKKVALFMSLNESEIKNLLDLNKTEEEARLFFISKYDVILKSAEYATCSATFISIFQKNVDWDIEGFIVDYAAQLKLKIDQKNNLKVAFEYTNLKKEKIALASFRGKYVYIDLWTTHCAPCLLQFPFLEKLKERYKGKNIEFVSISLDKKVTEWENYVVKHKIEGYSLYCPNEEDAFMSKINLAGVPRMLLIDPQGNIIDYKAKLPSDPELITDIDKLLVK